MRTALLAVGLALLAAAVPFPLQVVAQLGASSSCEDPLDQRPLGGTCVATVNGKVIDEAGAPLRDILMSVCARACYYGKTDAAGVFSVKVYSHLVVEQFATSVHGRPDYADYYAPLPRPVGDTYTYAAPLTLPRLPESGPDITNDSADSARRIASGGATLHLAAGTTVDISIDDRLLGPIGSQLRPVKVANPKTMPFIDPAAPPTLLYGFAPFEARFSRKTAVSFANTSGLPRGTAIDVRSMSGLVGEKPPAGRFSSVATAHVSADGTRIDMDPGQGVSGLTWLALFPR
jgi:hypothetical protein